MEKLPLKFSKGIDYFNDKKRVKQSIDKGIALYIKLKKTKPNDYNFSNESELNIFGYEYLNNDKIDAAVKIFTLNITEFPNSANAYDNRSEAYFHKKEYQLSKRDYHEVLSLEQTKPNAKEILLKIEKMAGLQ